MPEPVQIIRTSWSVGEIAHYKVVEPGIIKKKKKKKRKKLVVASLKEFYGRHYDLVNPYNVAVSRIVYNVFANEEISRLPKSRTYASTYNVHFLRSDLWVWWAKLAYQVMLTIRGRLITPFILESMSVGLNIRIRLRIYEFG